LPAKFSTLSIEPRRAIFIRPWKLLLAIPNDNFNFQVAKRIIILLNFCSKFAKQKIILSMPRDKAILKEQLTQLSKKELVEMLLKLSAKRYNYEYLLVNFLDKEGGEQTLYEEAKEDIVGLCQKEYRGRTIQNRQ